MQKFLLKASRFLSKHMWLYYLLNLTWGSLMTIIGLFIMIILLPFKRPSKYYGALCIKMKKDWGGVSIGLTFIRDTTSWDLLSMHEYGHTFQNAIFGPFMPFIVTIPSAIRYWFRYFKYERKGLVPPTDYDAIWFEHSATDIGTSIINFVH